MIYSDLHLSETIEIIKKIEESLKNAFDIKFAFNKYIIGEDFCINNLKLKPEDLDDPSFNMLQHLGFNENEIDKIKKELTQNFGSNVKLNYKYDKSLIGGLVLQVGSTMVDTSIKNKLQQIENRMIGA